MERETCFNLMNFFMVTSKRMSGSQNCEIFGQNEIRNRVVFVYLNLARLVMATSFWGAGAFGARAARIRLVFRMYIA